MAARGSQADANRLAARGRELPRRPGSDATPPDYFQQLLSLICEAVGPCAAIAWGIDEHGVLAKIAEVVPAARRAPPNQAAARAGAKRLLDALLSDGPQVCRLGGQNKDGADEVELLVPFRDDARPCGVIEVVISESPASPGGVERATAILQEIAGYASHYLRSQPAAPTSSTAPRFAERLNRLILNLHREPCIRQVALVAVNEGRSLLGCDRLSLLAWRGGRAEVLAVSGQERIVTRSNLVRAMTDFAAALGDAEKPLRFDGQQEVLPPQIRQPALDYVNHSAARSLEAIPIRIQSPAAGDHESDPRYETTGWLLCENFQAPTTVPQPAHAQEFADHVAMALNSARQLERAASPFRRAVRLFFAPSEFRSARQAAITAALVLAAVVGLGMLPVAYRVEALGRLMPVRRSELFAPADGRVREVLVDGNQAVTPGQVLLRIDNERLANELLITRHQLQEQQQLLATLEAQSAETKGQDDAQELIRLSGAISQTKIEIGSTHSRLKSLEGEAAELEVRSPLAGTVTTFEPARLLLNRPVERGEALLEVMDTTGPWELQLDLPARRVGHVLRAQTAAPDAVVPVQFTLATQPEKVFTGALRAVSSRIVTDAEAESVAPLQVNVDIREIPHPVAGADVIARVDCGKKSFARVLFGDVVDFFRSRLW